MLNIVWFDFSKKTYVFNTRHKIVSINNKPFESSRSVQMSRISGIMVFFARVLPMSMWWQVRELVLPFWSQIIYIDMKDLKAVNELQGTWTHR